LYKQFHPRANISIESYTGNVPADGKYYILKDGQIISGFRSLKAASLAYQKMVDEMALPRLVKEKDIKVTSGQIMDDYYSRVSNNALLGTSFGSKGKKTGRFTKSK